MTSDRDRPLTKGERTLAIALIILMALLALTLTTPQATNDPIAPVKIDAPHAAP